MILLKIVGSLNKSSKLDHGLQTDCGEEYFAFLRTKYKVCTDKLIDFIMNMLMITLNKIFYAALHQNLFGVL